MNNLFELAKSASSQETIDQLTIMLNDLEKQKRGAETLLFAAEEDEEEQEIIEAEIQKFEAWARKVQPIITNPEYQPTYEEMRLAVRILGIHAIVTPYREGHTQDIQIMVAPPKIMAELEKRAIVSPASSGCGFRCARQ